MTDDGIEMPPYHGEPNTRELVSFYYGPDGTISTMSRDGAISAGGDTQHVGSTKAYQTERRAAWAALDALLVELEPIIGDSARTQIDQHVSNIEVMMLMEVEARVIHALADVSGVPFGVLLVEGGAS